MADDEKQNGVATEPTQADLDAADADDDTDDSDDDDSK